MLKSSLSSSPARATASDLNTGNSVSRIAKIHQFSDTQQIALEQAIRDHATTMGTVAIGSARTAIFPKHAQEIIDQFEDAWNYEKASPKWTNTSIRKCLSVKIHENTKSDRKKKKSPKTTPSTASTSISSPQTPFQDAMTSHQSRLLSPRSIENVQTWGSDSVVLADIIVVVKPSPTDPWKRNLLSLPLWRCQPPIGGRDAAPQALQDWRDLSFGDFCRQLRNERAMEDGESIVWGEFDQIVTSDLTFSGAVQEQLTEAKNIGSAYNEVTFMVIGR